MHPSGNRSTIVMADDDADDRLMVQEALAEAGVTNKLYCVEDGEELLDYLYRRRQYAILGKTPYPGLILLDLNMPKKDGHEVLEEIKADPELRHIPVVVLTTSKADEDIARTYDLGASSFIVKPVAFESLVAIMKTLTTYWFEIVQPLHQRMENGHGHRPD